MQDSRFRYWLRLGPGLISGVWTYINHIPIWQQYFLKTNQMYFHWYLTYLCAFSSIHLDKLKTMSRTSNLLQCLHWFVISFYIRTSQLCTFFFYVLGLTQTRMSLVLDSTEAVLAAACAGWDSSFSLPVLGEKKKKGPENQLKESGNQSCVHREAVEELLALLRTINPVVPDAFYTPSPSTPPPPALPPSSGIHQAGSGRRGSCTAQNNWESIHNAGKSERAAFIHLKHSSRIFLGLFLFFGEKFQEPLKQSFTCFAKARLPTPTPSSVFSFKACSCVLLLL